MGLKLTLQPSKEEVFMPGNSQDKRLYKFLNVSPPCRTILLIMYGEDKKKSQGMHSIIEKNY